jgi:hypothetical protein
LREFIVRGLFRVQTALAVLAASAVMAAVPANSFANVYPTSLSQSANSFNTGQNVTLGYLLNEDATAGVTVSILNNANTVVRTITGGTTKGVNQVVWDGKDDSNASLPVGNYSFRVTTNGTTRTDWGLISTDNALTDFELPRGVAINNNPNSTYYGRVYVSNGRNSATGGGRIMSDGIYVLNSDLTDTNITGGTGPYTAGVAWQDAAAPVGPDTGGTSPFRLQVGSDDSVYITDWSDPHAGLWQATPDLSSAVEVLDSTGRAASGLNGTHGSISDVVILGSGDSRVLWTADEDYIAGGASTGSVLRYDIGATTTFSGDPSGVVYVDGATGAANRIINFENSIAVDNDGKLWLSQNRSNGTDKPSLIQVDPADGSVLWESLTSLGSPDPLRGTEGMAFDPVNNVIALVATAQASPRNGLITIFDPVTKSVLTTFQFGATPVSTGSGNNNDVAFDNSGNLYVTNRSGERLRVWSPPFGDISGKTYAGNAFTTNSLGALGSISLTASVNVLGDFNSDGKVDAADYVVWRQNDTANASLPNDSGLTTQAARYSLWKARFGTSGGAGLGSDAVPEPVSLCLLWMGMSGLAVISRRGRR